MQPLAAGRPDCKSGLAEFYVLRLTNKLNKLWRLVFEAVENGCLFLVRSLPSENYAQRGTTGGYLEERT